MQFRSSSPGFASQQPLRVRAIGLDAGDDGWLEGFLVEHRDVDAVDDDADDDFDVDIVDVTTTDRLALVARLAVRPRPVVVIGPDDPHAVNRYLQVGAADYLMARFAAIERAARLRSVARRLATEERARSADELKIGDVTISLDSHAVRRAGVPVRLTRNEFRLLELLVQRADEVVPHHEIVREIWGEESASSRHYLRTYIRQLRDKLEADADQPSLIVTEWGVGYRLQLTSPDKKAATG